MEQERKEEKAEEEVGQPGFIRENLTFTQLLTSPVHSFFSFLFLVVCPHHFLPFSDAGRQTKYGMWATEASDRGTLILTTEVVVVQGPKVDLKEEITVR